MTAARRRRLLVLGVPTLVAATVACLIIGLSPLLPVTLAGLGYAAVTPIAGMTYVLIVLMAPLGLWMIRADTLLASVFGGREYALSLSASVVAVALMVRVLVRQPHARQHLPVAVPVLLILAGYGLIGIAHHGLGQTVAGARITVMPAVLMIVAVSLTAGEVGRLITVTAWLMTANGVAAVVEYIIGPARLVAFGFEEGRAVRLIGDTFRAPGLTEVNAELGLLAGSFLLGYAALWLVRDLRPQRMAWHAAAVAAVVALALSTSRSAALLVAGGVGAAVVLNRGGGPAARKRARMISVALVVLLAGGLVAVGATGASSLLERFQIWGRLIESANPWLGNGLGGAGAATYSRAATSAPIFADNYFVSLILQYGYGIAAAAVVVIVWGLIRLSRRSAENERNAVHIAVLAGATCGSLMIELWEYQSAMACLALFVAHAMLAPLPAASPSPHPELPAVQPPPSPPDPAKTVRLTITEHAMPDPAETARLTITEHAMPDPAETARLTVTEGHHSSERRP